MILRTAAAYFLIIFPFFNGVNCQNGWAHHGHTGFVPNSGLNPTDIPDDGWVEVEDDGSLERLLASDTIRPVHNKQEENSGGVQVANTPGLLPVIVTPESGPQFFVPPMPPTPAVNYFPSSVPIQEGPAVLVGPPPAVPLNVPVPNLPAVPPTVGHQPCSFPTSEYPAPAPVLPVVPEFPTPTPEFIPSFPLVPPTHPGRCPNFLRPELPPQRMSGQCGCIRQRGKRPNLRRTLFKPRLGEERIDVIRHALRRRRGNRRAKTWFEKSFTLSPITARFPRSPVLRTYRN
ncbi:unnamed protein product [Calicophoron daubneyi]|uniref:Uncharacterized protein n=1 Tax=Calicophoron daubneyi TaxID=300641 RepID=A0AAV2TAC4_CALDB